MAHYFFVNYSRKDIEMVQTIISDLKKLSFAFWTDYDSIMPGDNWEQAVDIALKNAIGLIVFLSDESLEAQWSLIKIKETLEEGIVPIIFVFLEENPEVVQNIRSVHFIDFSPSNGATYKHKLTSLSMALDTILNNTEGTLSTVNINGLKSNITSNVIHQHDDDMVIPNAVFLVHGHDHQFLSEVKSTLSRWGIESIILREEENSIQSVPQNLFAKFHQYSARAKFAIILMTPDDMGAAIREYESTYNGEQVRDRSLQYRSRQNVILEMGFFYGRLGSERVLIIQKHTRGFFPRFERPSDLDGILFDEADDTSKWKYVLYRRLQQEGFQLRPSDYT
jgi:predicted nucleotide-binding protein